MEEPPTPRTYVAFEGHVTPETAQLIIGYLGDIATRTGDTLVAYTTNEPLTDDAGRVLNPNCIQYVQPDPESSDSIPVIPLDALIPHMSPQSPKDTKDPESRARRIWNSLRRKADEDPEFAEQYVVLARGDETLPMTHSLLGIRPERLAELVQKLYSGEITVRELGDRSVLALSMVQAELYRMPRATKSPTSDHTMAEAHTSNPSTDNTVTPPSETRAASYDTAFLNPRYCTVADDPEAPIVTAEHLLHYVRIIYGPQRQSTVTTIIKAVIDVANWSVSGLTHAVQPAPADETRKHYIVTDPRYPSLMEGFVASRLQAFVNKLSARHITIKGINERSIALLNDFLAEALHSKPPEKPV